MDFFRADFFRMDFFRIDFFRMDFFRTCLSNLHRHNGQSTPTFRSDPAIKPQQQKRPLRDDGSAGTPLGKRQRDAGKQRPHGSPARDKL